MSDLTPTSGGLPANGPSDRGPYLPPSRLSHAGVRDRHAEQRHVLAIRQATRDVELARVQIAARHAIDVAEMQAASARLTERKLLVDQQHRLSRALAGDDPVLAAKCAVLDDDFFQAQRVTELRRSQGTSN